MSMPKKHFRELAVILHRGREDARSLGDDSVGRVDSIAEDIADFYKSQNPAFQREKFMHTVENGL